MGNIKSYILGKWDEIKQGISNTAQSLIDAIKSPFIKAKEWILGLIEEAKDWGKNLINNIIDRHKIYSRKGQGCCFRHIQRRRQQRWR